MHVKGYTALYPKIEDAHRGKFKAIGSMPITNYFKWLGITTVELQPVHAFFGHKTGKEQINYWGYESLSFFAPKIPQPCFVFMLSICFDLISNPPII